MKFATALPRSAQAEDSVAGDHHTGGKGMTTTNGTTTPASPDTSALIAPDLLAPLVPRTTAFTQEDRAHDSFMVHATLAPETVFLLFKADVETSSSTR